ncbi:MAG: bifunctional diaminohydroxyphosphoribosylaminopyrimidine deaminase/5-amino-6-(5-phosphoribosylamino)uracil reductase RibD [Bacteroidetes bacterium]|nr:MAG: bifunctional diaminohydroxyphosphoribosylaminopyrimidine deaminase/5-amino-6-(5-phosphoribosylamino)uracil reductase RibD [Bacteroidota bacterium]
MMTREIYMHRCLELAKLGLGHTAPNPIVGAVLVREERIIGEGYHSYYGAAHAEVNCLHSVGDDDRRWITDSTLYVSLEPCAHFGKTPPCADLIIEKKIPRVVIACRDPFKEVNGRGIEKLRAAGVDLEIGMLEKEAMDTNRRFFTFHQQHRPYIILKWAESANRKIANQDFSRVHISNEITNRLIHKWRGEEASILVGTRTALHDNPMLTVRTVPGKNPIRLVVDMQLRLPESLHLFDQKTRTIVFNSIRHVDGEALSYYQITRDVSAVHQIVHALYQLNIQSVIVEGGAQLLQSFIDEDLWDEARIITNDSIFIRDGIAAPDLAGGQLITSEAIFSDHIRYYRNQ